MDKEKTQINITVTGHIASTTISHLIYKWGGPDKRTIKNLRSQMKRERALSSSMHGSWVNWKVYVSMVSPMTSPCENSRPGNIMWPALMYQNTRDFIKNMVTGTFHANCAVLIVADGVDELEAGIFKNGQTCPFNFHTGYKTTAGVKINGFLWYPTTRRDMRTLLRKSSPTLIKCNTGMAAFMSISAFMSKEDHILEPRADMPQFKGWKITYKDGNASATTVLEALDCIL